MKIIYLILFLFSFNLWSLTLSSSRSVPEGTSIQTFLFEDKILSYKKRSNYFDIKDDMRIGEFQVDNTSDIIALKKKVENILVEIKKVDKFLQSRGSSFNKLSGPIYHESIFYLEDFVIKSSSVHYIKLKDYFDKLQGFSFKQNSGIELSKDAKEFTIIEKGSIAKKEAFNMSFYCQKSTAPTICGYKDVGILYLK
jgi:hypothetical protein